MTHTSAKIIHFVKSTVFSIDTARRGMGVGGHDVDLTKEIDQTPLEVQESLPKLTSDQGCCVFSYLQEHSKIMIEAKT